MTAREVEVVSRFNPAVRVTIDPWAPNPLVRDVEQAHPSVFEQAMGEGPPPTMWVSGDLPPFTSSGVDPDVLMRLPFTARHHAATLTEPLRVLGLIEQASEDPDTHVEHQGLNDYISRMRAWAGGHYHQASFSPLTDAEADRLYDDLFKARDDANVGLQLKREQRARSYELQRRQRRLGTQP